MCIQVISKLWKRGKKIYGYKLAYITGYPSLEDTEYQPLYCCKWERWRIGEWTTATDTECKAYCNTKVKRLFSHLFKNKKRVKLIKLSYFNDKYYRPGYHFFETLEEAYNAWDSFGWERGDYGKKVLLYCEFKDVHTKGSQYDFECYVADKMMPMDELTKDEVREALAVEGK